MLKHKESTARIFSIEQHNDKIIEPICKVSVDRQLIRPIDSFDLKAPRAFVRYDHYIPSLLRFTMSEIGLNVSLQKLAKNEVFTNGGGDRAIVIHRVERLATYAFFTKL
ncbi:hypothetical protein APZ15_24670 [Burkholderia cepacia ATCC 25416]|nr:hypothetical protein APZ15_24670 [Burkholderia cepacia ATCC 25416]